MVNLAVVHGGGPTPVINSSLYGVVKAARESGRIERVYAAIGGTEGILKERFLDLLSFPEEKLKLLLKTPASAIGTSRFPLSAEDYKAMVPVFKKHDIKYVLLNGGNGTMDTCNKIYHACEGEDILVAGIPKTIDNDIIGTDHTPGFGSAARYVIETVREVGADVRAMPEHICIIETMGRHCGWLAASSALARRRRGDPPDLIYLPETPFDMEEFLETASSLYRKQKGVVVVVSEGIKDKEGNSITTSRQLRGRTLFTGGGASRAMADEMVKRHGIKTRTEVPGLAGRNCMAQQSSVDREEAVQTGEEAVRTVLRGESGVMIGCERIPDNGNYKLRFVPVPLDQIAIEGRLVPEKYIDVPNHDVTDEFLNWCRPLIGDELQEYINFESIYEGENGL
ncbi:diphosphate--fructose-6-phosphate 1-phosphotransferase [Anaerolentibacter hominis]|uniref:diphosphate--fructose-6-phosphate 1-phosphotransferase n=1 Tax=Anaerolentibacter hominis TaxID=3079009 RepID=UPI0031B82D4B